MRNVCVRWGVGLIGFRFEAGEHKPPPPLHPTMPWGWQEDYIAAISPPGRSTTRAQEVDALPITHSANYTPWINIHGYTRPRAHKKWKTHWLTRRQLGQAPVGLQINHNCSELSLSRSLTFSLSHTHTHTQTHTHTHSKEDIHDKTVLTRLPWRWLKLLW